MLYLVSLWNKKINPKLIHVSLKTQVYYDEKISLTNSPLVFHPRFAAVCPCASLVASLVVYTEHLPTANANTQFFYLQYFAKVTHSRKKKSVKCGITLYSASSFNTLHGYWSTNFAHLESEILAIFVWKKLKLSHTGQTWSVDITI